VCLWASTLAPLDKLLSWTVTVHGVLECDGVNSFLSCSWYPIVHTTYGLLMMQNLTLELELRPDNDQIACQVVPVVSCLIYSKNSLPRYSNPTNLHTFRVSNPSNESHSIAKHTKNSDTYPHRRLVVIGSLVSRRLETRTVPCLDRKMRTNNEETFLLKEKAQHHEFGRGEGLTRLAIQAITRQ
jgi:hypothetical protein